MIGLEDRQALARDIHTAHSAGARLKQACETAGIEVRTLQRWKVGAGLVSGDARSLAVRPGPRHALSGVERARGCPRFCVIGISFNAAACALQT